MKSKSDYSTTSSSAYQYVNGTNRLNTVAVKGGGTETFGYDDKGNQTKRNGTTEVVYNVFNKPTAINRLGSQVSLFYDANWSRYKQIREVDGVEITTHYIDKLYEVEFEEGNAGSEKASSYISDVAILIEEQQGAKIRFTHKDRLGSSATFTDHNGNVTAYRSYDPFGKPKMGDGGLMSSFGLAARLSNNLNDSDMATRRGFTDHEHLDEVEIIHMNGRVYDYNVGRFMGVDPFIQAPGNSQSINPYSYIMNNPMAGTDPTGYISELQQQALRDLGEQQGLTSVEVDTMIANSMISAIETIDSVSDVIAPIKGIVKHGVKELGKKAVKEVRLAIKGDKPNTPDLNKSSGSSGTPSSINGSDVSPNTGTAEPITDIKSQSGNSKPDFIVSENGVALPTNKDVNLVDSKTKDGDFLQIHNNHTDKKVDGSPHTHYPKQHDGNRTREIKPTDSKDIEKADKGVKNGTLRERADRSDKGGDFRSAASNIVKNKK